VCPQSGPILKYPSPEDGSCHKRGILANPGYLFTSQDYIYGCQKTCRYNNDSRLREIFLVKCQKQAFFFNKREAKVNCYAFLHVLKRDTCIKHEKTI
jgi:hypothetical protein